MSEKTYTIEPFPPNRQVVADIVQLASRKHMIQGLIEADVTRARERLRDLKEKTGESLSFTGFIIYCCAKAVDTDKHMQAYRDWRNRLIIFDDVDVFTPVERLVDRQIQVIPTVIRAANRKSIQEIHQEIRLAQSQNVGETRGKGIGAIPGFIRRLLFRILDKIPQMMKEIGGTVLVTSVGMFGKGASWGIPIQSQTLGITVGGIVSRPCLNNGQLENREHLCLTISLDHEIIDGAPAARFIQRFKEMVESGNGLFEE
jgi:pyruvate/2-oxoglutarate dehydrogenase complex dihydrolipoamide acyltransferase (E2) component